MSNFNPRYIRYAAINGRTPEEQTKHDKSQHNGASNMGFMSFIAGAWSEFGRVHPGFNRSAMVIAVTKPDGIKYENAHPHFDTWLQTYVPAPSTAK